METKTSPLIRLPAVDLMRGLAVILMFFPHVIYQIHNFSHYSGINHIAQFGLQLLAQGGFALAGTFFFSLVGVTFFISVANKPAQSFFKHKMIAGISLILIQEIISVGFFNGDMGLIVQYENNAQIFENTFHVLNLIGWAIIILSLLFYFGIRKANAYLFFALILLLLQPFNHIFSERFKDLMVIIAPVPVVNYLADALFISGCSIFSNLPTIFLGVYVGDIFLRWYNHKIYFNRRTLSIATLLMIAYSLIILFLINNGLTNYQYRWFVIQGYPYALMFYINIYFIYINAVKQIISNKEKNGNLFVSLQNILEKLRNCIGRLKIGDMLILLGIYALPVYIYHWDVMSKILKPISRNSILPTSPFTTYLYLFGFIIAWFLILYIYYSKLRDASIVKLIYFYFYQYRWIVFSLGLTFAILSLMTKLYLAYGIGPRILIYNYPFYYLFKYISLAFLIYFLRIPKAGLIKAK